ncbi:MAG: class I SAM-dependent methyltransferase [Chloroflexaceae bacterium]|nr:class I SAM-dependent methyltransferase [Chloroflexaceae bacterium]
MSVWNERYNTDKYIYGTVPNDFLVQVATYLPAGRILSLAAGEGRNEVYLAQQGYAVTAVDSSAVGLAKAQRLAAAQGVSIITVTADLTTYPIASATWHGIVSIFCHVPSAARRAMLARVVAGLVPGGVFVLEAYTPRQLERGTGGPPDRDRMITLAALQAELQGLAFIIGQEIERDIREGHYHNGRSEVVQVVARKPATVD